MEIKSAAAITRSKNKKGNQKHSNENRNTTNKNLWDTAKAI